VIAFWLNRANRSDGSWSQDDSDVGSPFRRHASVNDEQEAVMHLLATGTSSFFAARLLQGFGELGVSATAADSSFWSGAKSLPNVTRRLQVPSPNRETERYLDLIEDELNRRDYDLLLPTFEEGLLFAQHADVLRRRVKLLLPPFETMWQLHHKPSLHQFCTRQGLPSPNTSTPQTAAELAPLLGQLRYPVVLKPPAGNNSVGRVFCNTADDLAREFQQHAAASSSVLVDPPMVQEKIIGQPIYTLMLCDAGRKVAEVIYRPLRTFPDDGGTSVIRESIAHPDIAEITETIARETNWTGFLGFDFLVDGVTKTPYVIDANPRPNPAVQLGFCAGINWSALLIEMAQGQRPARVMPRLGVRVRSALLDWAWLLHGIKPGQNWISKSRQRLHEFFSPSWSLDANGDISTGFGSRPCATATILHGILRSVRAAVTGRSLGETMVEDLCYEVRPLNRGANLLMPSTDRKAA
jgi:predicted ATP-grasp superfamily ATP-dependent carboligase